MKIFIDSNVIIETFKKEGLKEATEILKIAIDNLESSLFYINEVVFSEVIYHLLIKGKIKNELSKIYLERLLFTFNWITIEKNIGKLSLKFIEAYNLKPNDALILATCKHYNIPYLLSLDEDFKEACRKEGIVLIDSVEKLKKILK